MSRSIYPRLTDIRISLDAISYAGKTGPLDNDSFRALMNLVAACAAGLCWTYSNPDDGSIPDDDDALRRYAFTTKRKWLQIRPKVEPFFDIRKGRWHLSEEWISVGNAARPVVPSAIYERVQAREGKRCAYCGDAQGPFDLDHIFPVSRGGSDDPSNLAIACVPCNRSKGAKTLKEWGGR